MPLLFQRADLCVHQVDGIDPHQRFNIIIGGDKRDRIFKVFFAVVENQTTGNGNDGGKPKFDIKQMTVMTLLKYLPSIIQKGCFCQFTVSGDRASAARARYQLATNIAFTPFKDVIRAHFQPGQLTDQLFDLLAAVG